MGRIIWRYRGKLILNTWERLMDRKKRENTKDTKHSVGKGYEERSLPVSHPERRNRRNQLA